MLNCIASARSPALLPRELSPSLRRAEEGQWCKNDSLVSVGRKPAPFVVTAFFGGSSKNSQVKSAGKGCFSCLGKGAVDCEGCKGTGKNKKNGNIFERWKCYDCQGFGLVACPKCGTGGLTPEQRGER